MFDIGALLALVAQKPEMAAQLDAAGIPPINPQMMKLGGPGPSLGGMMGSQPQGDPGMPVPGVENPGTTQAPFDTSVSPAPTQTEGGTGTGDTSKGLDLSALAGLKGIIPPTAPQPIMSGGVAGGVKPPDVKAANSSSAPGAIQALLAALLGGRGGAPAVPDLGSYIRGGRY